MRKIFLSAVLSLTALMFTVTTASAGFRPGFWFPRGGNHTEVNKTSVVSVHQSNAAYVTNVVSANANTGKNSSSFNLGKVTTTTGPATTSVNVSNTLNFNWAKVEGCCDQGCDEQCGDECGDHDCPLGCHDELPL